jgi:hypothetical protein
MPALDENGQRTGYCLQLLGGNGSRLMKRALFCSDLLLGPHLTADIVLIHFPNFLYRMVWDPGICGHMIINGNAQTHL